MEIVNTDAMFLGHFSSASRRVLATMASLAAIVAVVQAPADAAAKVTVSGAVTSPEAGHPGLDGIQVCAKRYDAKGKYRGSVCRTTDANGRYSMSVPIGSYKFVAEQQYLYGQWTPQSYAGGKLLTVKSARTINMQMVRGARISGVLHMPDNSSPGDNFLSVWAHRVWSNGTISATTQTYSNVGPSGQFDIAKLPAGKYALRVEDNGYEPRLAEQWFPAAATPKASTYVTVTGGQQASEHDMTLTPGSTLQFTIKNPRGKTTAGQVRLYDAGGREIFGRYAASTGPVKFTGLYPGTYRAKGWTNLVNFTEWYSHKKSYATSNSIVVGRGATTSRTFVINYPTLKATKRPRVKIDLNTVNSTAPKWNKKAHVRDIVWYRDGKRLNRPGFRWVSTRKSDVGHRLKVCYTARRTGYADGRSCSKYSKKITMY